MTAGEQAYLVLVLAGFLGFAAVLAYYSSFVGRRATAAPAEPASAQGLPAAHAH